MQLDTNEVESDEKMESEYLNETAIEANDAFTVAENDHRYSTLKADAQEIEGDAFRE